MSDTIPVYKEVKCIKTGGITMLKCSGKWFEEMIL